MTRDIRQLPVLVIKAPIWTYRLTLSAVLGPACRFHPTCSAYALEALDSHGPVGGLWLTLRRLLRCHPWGESGIDPVPAHRGRDPGRRQS